MSDTVYKGTALQDQKSAGDQRASLPAGADQPGASAGQSPGALLRQRREALLKAAREYTHAHAIAYTGFEKGACERLIDAEMVLFDAVMEFSDAWGRK